jgi:hypothetical protein
VSIKCQKDCKGVEGVSSGDGESIRVLEVVEGRSATLTEAHDFSRLTQLDFAAWRRTPVGIIGDAIRSLIVWRIPLD